MNQEVILSVRNLSIEYKGERGQVHAVSNVSFDVHRGEFFGLAGESGCGKSTLAFAIMQLLKSGAQIAGGEILFKGENLLTLGDEMRRFRWEKTSMVLQSAMNNLNPVVTIGSQLCDTILAHERVSAREAMDRARHLLELVNIAPDRVKSFPHELSGGMKQRVVIAMALALKPDMVIFDEPTTALDVVVQYNIIRKIIKLKEEMGFAILFITHDLPLMLEICDRIAIMYAGHLVEVGPVGELCRAPQHPYTKGLLGAFPSLVGEKKRLQGIGGSVPDLVDVPQGCLFRERCFAAGPECGKSIPPLEQTGEGHFCACWHNLMKEAKA